MHYKYLIWSFEHHAWWMPNHRGYSTNIHEAGLYSFEEASQICLNANLFILKGEFPNEAMIPLSDNK